MASHPDSTGDSHIIGMGSGGCDKEKEKEMKKQIEQLKEFHKSFTLPMRDKPRIIPVEEYITRNKLLCEEVQEMSDAFMKEDIVEFADAIVDVLYVVIGTAVQSGLADKLEAMFDEVHRSNMSKLDKNGKPILRADGKVSKSDLFFPPDLYSIIFKER